MSRGRPTTLPSPWRELAAAAGGVAALAARFEVDPSTIGRWARQGGPKKGPARLQFLTFVNSLVKKDP